MNGQDHARSALVLYGTETGTSQDLAEEIGRCLERIHFHTDVLGLDLVHHRHLSTYDFAVFVVSTTGQGDFPDNARKFWSGLLRKKLSSSTLAGIDYALVGIGDSSYLKFNWAARKLDKRLRQLGASPILAPCEADEQGEEGTEGTFLAWLPLFQDAILKTYPLPDGQNPIPDDVSLPSKWRLERTVGAAEGMNGVHSAASRGQQVSPDSFPVILETNKRVTPPEHWQDVRYMSLKASHTLEYMPGDAIAISPRNMSSDVELLIDRMNWRDIADTPIRLVSTRSSLNTNSALLNNNPILTEVNLTLRTLLTDYLDINAIPRRSFLGCIANYTADSMHKERLLEFTETQYLDEYFDYATRPRRSILEILQEFDTVHLPWEEVTNIFPLMRPRQFSIASGGPMEVADDGTRFELLIAIVKYRTVIKRIREGVCTRYLAQLPEGTTLQVSLKTEGRLCKSTENLASQNHLLIGAGTGIAPLRALIHDKAAAVATATATTTTAGRTTLIFGCRNEKSDFFFRDEWPAQQTAGLELITAFSRDQSSKVYVQDRIREHSALVWEMLRRRRATVVVCGSSGQMPKAVKQAVMDALIKEDGERRGTVAAGQDGGDVGGDEIEEEDDDGEEPITNQEAAERYIARLEKEGRYRQETW